MSIAKRAAGRRAAELIKDLCRDGCLMGIGTGSTVKHFIEAADELGYLKRSIIVVSSIDTALTLRNRGIRNVESGICPSETLDIYIDGADEVDYELRMIKGRGAALLREKILATNSKYRIYVVDESKIVDILGSKKPVPIEVVVFALLSVIKELNTLGYRAKIREGVSKDGPVVTDNGNVIIDVYTGPMNRPEEVHRELKLITGVIETGIFIDLADIVVIGRSDGSTKELRKSRVPKSS